MKRIVLLSLVIVELFLLSFVYSHTLRVFPLEVPELRGSNVVVVEPESCELTVMVVATQHGNEPAGTIALRELVSERFWSSYPTIRLILVYPLNLYGYRNEVRHEIGGRDVNRHWALADLPENRGLLRLMMRYQPELLVDLHEAKPRPDTDIMYSYPALSYVSSSEKKLYDELERILRERLTEEGFTPKRYYLLRRGVKGGYPTIRILRNYAALRGMMAILVETIREDDIERRVRGQQVALKAVLNWALSEAEDIQAALMSRAEPRRMCYLIPESYEDLVRVLDRNGYLWFKPTGLTYLRAEGYVVTGYRLRLSYGEPCWELRVEPTKVSRLIDSSYRVYPSWAISLHTYQGVALERLLIPSGRCESFFEVGSYRPRRYRMLPLLIISEEDCLRLIEERIERGVWKGGNQL